jgi:hypothetical protein
LEVSQLWDNQNDDRAQRHYGELEKYRLPAGQLYRGRQHIQLMKGIELLRRTFGPEVVDLFILSAGFGLVPEHQPLPPYNATFSGLPPASI